MTDLERLVTEALPNGQPASPSGLGRGIERPWRTVRDAQATWAIYVLRGRHWPKTTDAAIRELGKRSSTIRPCILVADADDIATVASHAVPLRVPLIVDVAGRGRLIALQRTTAKRKRQRRPPCRIPAGILPVCAKSQGLAKRTKNLLRRYATRYRQHRTPIADDKEQELLREFFLAFMRQNGITRNLTRASDTLRRLEQAGWGGDRDHYFHSFQNFFFGLWAIAEAPRCFRHWANAACLNWNVLPEFVWFLVTLWHDVGYALKVSETVTQDLLGVDAGDSASAVLSEYLSNPLVIEGRRNIASLMAHLYEQDTGTAWMPPSAAARLTRSEAPFDQAISDDLRGGHGVAGALRLYTDMKELVDRCGSRGKRDVLLQSLLLAAASIPFHDWHFRRCVREQLGSCAIPALSMPFAVLLAFLDSIQDDRRELGDQPSGQHFLTGLEITGDRVVTAVVDQRALRDDDLVWKVIEALDIHESVVFDQQSLVLRYPDWMVS